MFSSCSLRRNPSARKTPSGTWIGSSTLGGIVLHRWSCPKSVMNTFTDPSDIPLGGFSRSSLNSTRRQTADAPVRQDAHCAEHGRDGAGRTVPPREGDRPRERARGVRFHPGALRGDAVIPLYDLLGRGGARQERTRSRVPLGGHLGDRSIPANGTEPGRTNPHARTYARP